MRNTNRKSATFGAELNNLSPDRRKREKCHILPLNLANFVTSGTMRGATLLFLIVGMLFLGGCKVKEVPVEVKYETHYIDSVRLKDSIVYIPTERIVDIVPIYDTLRLESSMSISTAWVDTNYHILQGRLENKQGKLVEVRYVDRWRTRDSIVEIEKPLYIKGDTVTEVIYPWWAWIGLTFTVLCVGYCGWRLYRRFFL